jgi:hypothetical protein
MSSMSIDSRRRCSLRTRRGVAGELLGALYGGGLFRLNDDFPGFQKPTP